MSFVGCLSKHSEQKESLQMEIDALIPEKKAEYLKRLKETEEFASTVWGWICITGFIATIAFFIWVFC